MVRVDLSIIFVLVSLKLLCWSSTSSSSSTISVGTHIMEGKMFPFFFLGLCFQFSHGWLTGTRDVVLCYHFYMVLFFCLRTLSTRHWFREMMMAHYIFLSFC